MSDVVGIRYVTAGPIDYCSPGELTLGIGDYVVVERDGGEQLGWVVLTPEQVIAATIERPLRAIERIATEEDVAAWRRQRERAEEDIGRAQDMAARTDPRVRVASIVYDLAGEHAQLDFTGREKGSYEWLRKDAEELLGAKVRVEQVGDRDRAKALGPGVMGLCGRELCCTSWMTTFPSVSIRMAKDQGLAPNPSKISGLCGRLLCCLSFEVEAYQELRGDLPKVGKRVTTPVGRAKVIAIDALRQVVRLRLDETGEVAELAADELRQQYGTTVRPEELEATVEEPARAEAEALAEATIAVLEPVTEPPKQRRSWERAPEGAGSERSATTRRRRRRRGRARDTDSNPEVASRTPAAERTAPAPSERSEDSTAEGEDEQQAGPKRRRRGRRGGRRRRGRGGGGGESGGSSGGGSGGE